MPLPRPPDKTEAVFADGATDGTMPFPFIPNRHTDTVSPKGPRKSPLFPARTRKIYIPATAAAPRRNAHVKIAPPPPAPFPKRKERETRG